MEPQKFQWGWGSSWDSFGGLRTRCLAARVWVAEGMRNEGTWSVWADLEVKAGVPYIKERAHARAMNSASCQAK